ncbi:hypothetical protein KBB45_01905 [Myxococcota bacterium]|nr:hypothetical protein [Myxococcota bacterium]
MSSFAGEDPVRLLKIVEMDIDALDKQRGKLESVADNNHATAANTFDRDIGPEIDRLRSTISKIIDICPENDDFARVDSLLSSLFFIEARFYSILSSDFSRYSSSKIIAEQESLFFGRDSSSLWNVALHEIDAGKNNLAVFLLEELERKWPDEKLALKATKKRLELNVSPVPYGPPAAGKYFKELCRRHPTYRNSVNNARRQLARAIMAEDPEYFDWVFYYYLGIDDIPQPLIASLFELGYDFMVQSRGAKATLDFGLRLSKRLEGESLKKLVAMLQDTLLASIVKKPVGKNNVDAVEALISLNPSDATFEKLLGWYQEETKGDLNPNTAAIGGLLAEASSGQISSKFSSCAFEYSLSCINSSSCSDYSTVMSTILKLDPEFKASGQELVTALEKKSNVEDAEQLLPMAAFLAAYLGETALHASAETLLAWFRTNANDSQAEPLITFGELLCKKLPEPQREEATKITAGLLAKSLEHSSDEHWAERSKRLLDLGYADKEVVSCIEKWLKTSVSESLDKAIEAALILSELDQQVQSIVATVVTTSIISVLPEIPGKRWLRYVKALKTLGTLDENGRSIADAFQQLSNSLQYLQDELSFSDDLIPELPADAAEVVRSITKTRLVRLAEREMMKEIELALLRRAASLDPHDKALAARIRWIEHGKKTILLLVGGVFLLCVIMTILLT